MCINKVLDTDYDNFRRQLKVKRKQKRLTVRINEQTNTRTTRNYTLPVTITFLLTLYLLVMIKGSPKMKSKIVYGYRVEIWCFTTPMWTVTPKTDINRQARPQTKCLRDSDKDKKERNKEDKGVLVLL